MLGEFLICMVTFMSGDWYADYPSDLVIDPMGPPTGSKRVQRGGSWGDTALNARSAKRYGFGPGNSYKGLGLRLSRTP